MKRLEDSVLTEIVERLVKGLHPEKIILFGSQAWGIPNESSDIDLLIILTQSDEPSYRRARRVYQYLRGIRIPIDVIVRTHDEIERSKNVVTSLAHLALEKGRVLYG